MEGNTHLEWNEHSTIIPSNLHNMLERKLFVDLTLATDEGLSIPVHQVILCAASPYFMDLVSQHPADVHTTIILSDISFEHLTALVEFIYKGNVRVPCCQLPSLLEAASSLKIEGLIDTIKDSQLQHDHLETHQPESEGTLLKIVSVKSVAQMPSEEPLSWENSDEAVKEEVDYDSDNTVLYEPEENDLISGDGDPEWVNELLPLPSSNASNYSTGMQSYGSSSKGKRSHQHHSSLKTNIFTCTPISKRKSSVEDKEAGSSGKRSLKAVAVKEKEPQEALDCAILGDGTPPAPIVFKRDPNVAEEDKNFDDGKYEELMENDFEEDARSDDGDGASNYSSLEESSTAGSSDEDYDRATCSAVRPKSKATKTAKNLNSATIEKKQRTLQSPSSTTRNETFKCDECGLVYKYKGSLTTHLKNVCGKAPSFFCTRCTYRTPRKGDLKKHLLRVHSINDSQSSAHGIGATICPNPEIPFKCKTCKRSYKSKDKLALHLRRYCGVDPAFHCTLCGHRFKRKVDLRFHLTNVHGIIPADFPAHGVGYAFRCDLCPFRCGRKAAFDKHMTMAHAAGK